jgi:hypothetical protein
MKLLAVFASLVILAGCGKSDSPSSDSSDGGGSSSNPGSSDPKKPWDDVSKPYLDDKKMGNFIESLKDANGPFDAISKGKVSAFNTGKVMDEFETASKKHGFASGEEYLGAWTRIMAAYSQIMQEDSNQSMVAMHEETIKNHRETLKKPDVTPEMKQTLEDQIKSSQEALAALKQPREGGVNAKDIETFKKHRGAFEESMKKWK